MRNCGLFQFANITIFFQTTKSRKNLQILFLPFLPHIILFLRHGGDFVGYIFGGEFDIIHEGLLCLVAADVHHLEDGVLVAQIHIGDAGASGGVACHAVIAWHDHIAVKVGLRFFLLFSQRLFLLHGEFGRYLFFQ